MMLVISNRAYTQEELKAAVAAYEKNCSKMQQQDKPQQAAGAASESADVQFLAENKTKAGVKLQRLVCNTSLLKKAQVNNQLRSLWLKYITKAD